MMALPISKIPEIGAGVIFPTGFNRVERRAKNSEGKVYLWAKGEPYPLDDCKLPKCDRLSDWFGKCPLCKENATDYAPRQKIDNQFLGGFSFCEPCKTTWNPDFK